MVFDLKTIWKQFVNHKWSMLLLLIGFVSTMATAIAIPNYSEAVNRRLLAKSLGKRNISITNLSNQSI